MWSPLVFRAMEANKQNTVDVVTYLMCLNSLSPELNLICYLLALLAHHFLHVSRIRVKSLNS
jgi:hypothetical protein